MFENESALKFSKNKVKTFQSKIQSRVMPEKRKKVFFILIVNVK